MGDMLDLYRCYIGMMEKKMEATIMGLYRTAVNIGTILGHTEKMETKMETTI